MDLENYPVALFICIILYYIFFRKKNNPDQEVAPNLVEENPTSNQTTQLEENGEEFTLRCFNLITTMLEGYGDRYHVSPDRTSFCISFIVAEGITTNYYINSSFSENKKVIVFDATVSDLVPDHKLAEVAELINRLNEQLLVGSLYLNYETRSIENRLTYYVGNTELSQEKFNFYYMMILSINIRNSFARVVEHNENPALVALDWTS